MKWINKFKVKNSNIFDDATLVLMYRIEQSELKFGLKFMDWIVDFEKFLSDILNNILLKYRKIFEIRLIYFKIKALLFLKILFKSLVYLSYIFQSIRWHDIIVYSIIISKYFWFYL